MLNIMSINDRVDKDGVLDLIQKLEYNLSPMTFKVTYFTGWQKIFSADQFCDVELSQGNPTFMQWLDAYRGIEAYSLKHWADWYVDQFKMQWVDSKAYKESRKHTPEGTVH